MEFGPPPCIDVSGLSKLNGRTFCRYFKTFSNRMYQYMQYVSGQTRRLARCICNGEYPLGNTQVQYIRPVPSGSLNDSTEHPQWQTRQGMRCQSPLFKVLKCDKVYAFVKDCLPTDFVTVLLHMNETCFPALCRGRFQICPLLLTIEVGHFPSFCFQYHAHTIIPSHTITFSYLLRNQSIKWKS